MFPGVHGFHSAEAILFAILFIGKVSQSVQERKISSFFGVF
jgi:hypothetical protein